MATTPAQEIEILIRARYPVIYVVTWEENRVEEVLAQIAKRREKKLFGWSVARGIQQYGTVNQKPDVKTADPNVALDHVADSMENAIYIFRDLHPFLTAPQPQCNAATIRRVRELAFQLKNSYKTLVLVSPTLQLPLDLQKEVTVVEWDLPDRSEIDGLMSRTLAEVNEATGKNLSVGTEARAQILSAASGLTLNEAENVLAKTLVTSGRLSEDDLPIILAEKEQTVRKSGMLEYMHPDARLENVGGLDILKDWIEKRRVAFEPRAQEYGLPAPKGVLLIGVQGCGKSLAAKAIAAAWHLPLLRLDVGRLFGSLLGSSEENVRTAIRVAESVAPAILWVDEIEKSMAGSSSSGSTDGGTSARVLSSFLTWLQEKTSPVFVIATANDVTQLPPELLRKGRLDETFFVDLPGHEERREIICIHLKSRGHKLEGFNIDALAKATEGYSGAELEQVVISALFDAYAANQPLSQAHMIEAAASSVPLSRTMKENIDRLRNWAEGRARRASSSQEARVDPFEPIRTGRRLEMDE
jgi:SpoVK/Ycf46/Vps4 family AAA+-type ATPase